MLLSPRTRRIALACGVVLPAVMLAACGGKDSGTSSSATAGAPAATASKSAPKPTGREITIEMITDEKGNYFKPNEIEAKPGDVLKFVLTVGVHNVDFLADSNPGVPDLPPPSAFSQLPGQVLLIPVNFAAGKTYYFQCDPHALLGMKGHLKVEN